MEASIPSWQVDQLVTLMEPKRFLQINEVTTASNDFYELIQLQAFISTV